jgi:hypothetical protein
MSTKGILQRTNFMERELKWRMVVVTKEIGYEAIWLAEARSNGKMVQVTLGK